MVKKNMIYLASDHAGYELKEKIKLWLTEWGYKFEDLGAGKYSQDDDYPDFIIPAAEKVVASKNAKGVILGGSGQGEALAANKVKGIRSTIYYGGPLDLIRLSKEHNNANILSLGARFISAKKAKEAVCLWLETEFSNDKRHIRRLNKIKKYEMKN